jgi:hypothetical protein
MQKLSPNRERLAALIAERETGSAELAKLTARVHRLERAKETIAPLESELVALNIAETSAMARWSEADDGSPAPAADAKLRAKIEAQLLAARAQVRAADAATAGLMPQVEKVGAGLRSLSVHITQAAANVVVEDATSSLFPKVKEAIADVEAIRGRIVAARRFMASFTDRPEGQHAGPIQLDFEGFDRAFNEASGRPTFVSDPAEWFGLASRLAVDPTAKLEVAQS